MAGLAQRAVESINRVYGHHRGYRAAHAKGSFYRGTFTATPEAAARTTAEHMQGEPVETVIRFSKGSGDPTWHDGTMPDTMGMAVKFQPPSGAATDILAITLPCFFVNTPDDFIAFLRATRPGRRDPAKPNPLRMLLFMASHRNSWTAIRAMMRAKAPSSYATARYNALHAYNWIAPDGRIQPVRYSWLPGAGEEFLPRADARELDHDYLRQEMGERVGREPVRFSLRLHLPGPGDRTDDVTRPWRGGPQPIEAGTLSIDRVAPELEHDGEIVIMDPARVIDGIECSDDPILNFRPKAYAVSAERRQAARSSGRADMRQTA